MKKTPLATLILILLLGVLPAPWVGAETTRTLDQSFSVPADGALRLANLAGTVKIVSGSSDQVVVKAKIHAQGKNAKVTKSLLEGMKWIQHPNRDGKVGWALSYPVKDYRSFHYPRNKGQDDGFLAGFFKGRSSTRYLGERVSIRGSRSSSSPTLYANLVIEMPAGSPVAVRNAVGRVDGGDLAGSLWVDTGSGAVTIQKFTGLLSVDTGSGKVWLGEVQGSAEVDTGSGSIHLNQLVGSGVLDTGSGSVKVKSITASKLMVDTGSGSVEIHRGVVDHLKVDTGSGGIRLNNVELVKFQGDTGSGGVKIVSSLSQAKLLDIDTGSGGVEIIAGPDASFDLSADLGSGKVSTGYSDAKLKKNGRKVVGVKRGDGRTKIKVDTGSGGCRITPMKSTS